MDSYFKRQHRLSAKQSIRKEKINCVFFHTKHLVLQTMNEGTAGPRGNEIHRVGVQFFLRGIISPLPARGELSRCKELLGPFVGCTLPLDTQENN